MSLFHNKNDGFIATPGDRYVVNCNNRGSTIPFINQLHYRWVMQAQLNMPLIFTNKGAYLN